MVELCRVMVLESTLGSLGGTHCLCKESDPFKVPTYPTYPMKGPWSSFPVNLRNNMSSLKFYNDFLVSFFRLKV